MTDLPPEFRHLLDSIKGKRARIVITHILEHGHITTETLEMTYGYKHPPRAVQDVRDQGIPLESFNAKSEDGRTIAAYRFPQDLQMQQGRIGGRSAFSKSLKKRLIAESRGKCAICLQSYDGRFLQIDHRVPYQVAGDSLTENFMLVCRSCNRSKSWACEHCPNWLEHHDINICLTCYWCSPIQYDHVAMTAIKRLELIWQQDETPIYEALRQLANSDNQSLSEFVKQLLSRYVRGTNQE